VDGIVRHLLDAGKQNQRLVDVDGKSVLDTVNATGTSVQPAGCALK
jgi:hypothetical protein